MPNLYAITGPAGVGKSTVSKRLAESLEKSVIIEGDDIYHQVVGGYVSPWKENNHLNVFWKVVLDSIDTYLKNGYDVVFNYIISLDELKNIKSKINNYDIKFILLTTDEKTLLLRDSERPEDCQMKERCIVLLNNFKNKNYNKQHILDTTNLSIDEIVNTIKNDEKFLLEE